MVSEDLITKKAAHPMDAIIIGEFQLGYDRDGQFWIWKEDGESMALSKDDLLRLETVLRMFWKDVF